MSSTRAIDWLDRYKGLSAKRDQWKTIWQELADLLHPTRGGFTTEMLAGQETNSAIYDSTPMQARRALATTISGLMKPSESDWFWMKSEDDDLNEQEGPKRWFDIVQTRMWDWIYDPSARFIQQSGAVDNDLATFGLGYLWIDENRKKTGLSFKSLLISSVALDENSDGEVDTACISSQFTARQAVQKFGEQKLAPCPKVLEALRSTDPKAKDHKFEFIQCIYPREERDTRYRDSLNLPFASLIVAKDDEDIIDESGYHEFPLAVPRWEVYPGEIYPRSPGMLALPDARTLQTMGHTILVAGEKTVDPPLWYVDDGMISAVRTFPGSVTAVSADTVKDLRGPPMGVLEMGKNLPVGREMQQDYRDMVGSAFYKDVFNLPIDQAKMTATEIMERKQQFLRTIGPTLAQLEQDYIGVIIRRVFGLMMRAGAFPPPPDELKNTKANFEFMSPVQQAKAHVDAAGLRASLEFLLPLAQFKPGLLDRFDDDEIVSDLPDMFGFRQKWLKSTDKVEAERQQRAQMMQAQMAMQTAGGAAAVGKDVAGINESLAKAESMAGAAPA